MGIGKDNKFTSDKVEYSSPCSIFEPLAVEFSLERDVCASIENHRLPAYWTVDDNALTKDWMGNCWMNPPFGRSIGKWVRKAHADTQRFGGTKVCLIPVRSNTRWWGDVICDAEVRFIVGEVVFGNAKNGLWLPMCILIFGEFAKIGRFSTVYFANIRKGSKVETKKKPVKWKVTRDSDSDEDEFFNTEEEARKNALLGIADTHIIPIFE